MYNNYRYHNNDRLLGGGFVGPLLLGGVAGYALGNNNNNFRPMAFYPYPYYNMYNPYYYPYNYYR